jgi:hypothetical protein
LLIPTSKFENSLSIARKGIEFVWEVPSERRSVCYDKVIPHGSFESLTCRINELGYVISICGSMAKPKWTNDSYELAFDGWHMLKLNDSDLVSLGKTRYVKGQGFLALLGPQQVTWTSLNMRTYAGCEGSNISSLLFIL